MFYFSGITFFDGLVKGEPTDALSTEKIDLIIWRDVCLVQRNGYFR
ncbi:MAG: hypothetical protein IPK08_08000 [Bacteroidetes bacterium]|nr:hypothetical protein [Bacteroidota bacterium]